MSSKPTKKPSGEPEKSKREDRDKPTFNKDASPFSPSEYSQPSDPSELTYQPPPPPFQASKPLIRKSTTNASPTSSYASTASYEVILNNIPNSISQNDLHQFIDSCIKEDHFHIIEFNKGSTNTSSNSNTTTTAVLKITNLLTYHKIKTNLSQAELEGNIIEVKLKETDTPHSSSASPVPDPHFNPQFVPPLQAFPYWRQVPFSHRNSSSSISTSQRVPSSSSNRTSVDSRRTSSKTSNSTQSSISSMGTSQRSSTASSVGNDLSFPKKPAPPFMLRMAQNRDRNTSSPESIVSNTEDSQSDTIVQSEQYRRSEGPESGLGPGPGQGQEPKLEQIKEKEKDKEDVGDENEYEDEYILIRSGDGENPDEVIKVNPKRLFIGNVPYNSTWTSLKNFLITKSLELEPDNNISIHRVEIPTQQILRHDPYFLYHQHRGQMVGGPTFINKSRGFAIVRTGDRESSEKLIQMFDNVEFEGRLLTVRFDRYPDFNNYTVQQMYGGGGNNSSNSINSGVGRMFPMPPQFPIQQQFYPHSPTLDRSNTRHHMSQTPLPLPQPYQQQHHHQQQRPQQQQPSSPSVLSSLAFEKNSYQHNLYYGSTGTGMPSASVPPPGAVPPLPPPGAIHPSYGQAMVSPNAIAQSARTGTVESPRYQQYQYLQGILPTGYQQSEVASSGEQNSPFVQGFFCMPQPYFNSPGTGQASAAAMYVPIQYHYNSRSLSQYNNYQQQQYTQQTPLTMHALPPPPPLQPPPPQQQQQHAQSPPPPPPQPPQQRAKQNKSSTYLAKSRNVSKESTPMTSETKQKQSDITEPVITTTADNRETTSTTSEEEKARELMNSIKDLSLG
ncbi:hypothetical protein MEU_03047 [Candida albicans P37005]|nr:hypothetical protein MEU_03047 [Candida albicans P37005]KHC63904.1 hypothetical protein MGE_03044 [Candida albicans P75010]